MNATAQQIYEAIENCKPQHGDRVLLRDLEGQIIELVLRYGGGSATIVGRVRIIAGSTTTFISVGPAGEGCTLPIDTESRVQIITRSEVREDVEYVVNV